MWALCLAAGCVRSGVDEPRREHPLPRDLLVEFRRSGGLAGRDDLLSITHAGRAVLSTRDDRTISFQVTPERLHELRAALAEARFASLRRSYRNRRIVPDDWRFEVSHEGKRIRLEGQASYPPRLGRVIDLLHQITNEATFPSMPR